MVKTNPQESFWKLVDIKTNNECWNWQGYVGKSGYGTYTSIRKLINEKRCHRIAWVLTNGKIPDNKIICHHCDNKICVNPNHLFVGTQKDNVRDMIKKGRYKNVSEKIIKTLKKEDILFMRNSWEKHEKTPEYFALQYKISVSFVCKILCRVIFKNI